MAQYTITLNVVVEAKDDNEAKHIAGELGESFDGWECVNNAYVERIDNDDTEKKVRL